jgi:hypothetical protein
MINGGRRLLPVPSRSRVGGVAVVVNHLHLSDPLTEETAQAFREFAPRIVDAGATAAQVLPVDDTHLVLILEFASAQDVALTTPVHRLFTNAAGRVDVLVVPAPRSNHCRDRGLSLQPFLALEDDVENCGENDDDQH